VISLHADDEMDDDDICVFDAEHAILTGTIIERQKDRETSEWKYLIRGRTLDGERGIVIVVKITPTGKAIWLTAYAE